MKLKMSFFCCAGGTGEEKETTGNNSWSYIINCRSLNTHITRLSFAMLLERSLNPETEVI